VNESAWEVRQNFTELKLLMGSLPFNGEPFRYNFAATGLDMTPDGYIHDCITRSGVHGQHLDEYDLYVLMVQYGLASVTILDSRNLTVRTLTIPKEWKKSFPEKEFKGDICVVYRDLHWMTAVRRV
jgi:hypothetical protein